MTHSALRYQIACLDGIRENPYTLTGAADKMGEFDELGGVVLMAGRPKGMVKKFAEVQTHFIALILAYRDLMPRQYAKPDAGRDPLGHRWREIARALGILCCNLNELDMVLRERAGIEEDGPLWEVFDKVFEDRFWSDDDDKAGLTISSISATQRCAS